MGKTGLDMNWIETAIDMIKSGVTNRVDSTDKNIKVYQCGEIIRVDIKTSCL